ncbi:hypothetical protein DPMN_179465 [Dreissena polymorpha]|uniref:Uncharacterized protein n=1 Tax=Dreissena polymorpha TaxID=45954 RepID=A0A9D4IMD2_DREPO|nr:hypothetical protein DPMN_179465 [Dreissena polymorpha]
MFNDDQTINMASGVLTSWRKPTNQQTNQQTGQKQYVPHYYSWGHKNAPTLGSHVFQQTRTIFELIQDIIGTNVHWNKSFIRSVNMNNVLPHGGHILQAT